MIALRFLKSALDDLDDVCAWTATHRPAGAAEAMARLLMEAAEGLRAFPERGRPGRVAGTRELVIPRTPFVLVYRLAGRGLQVLAILHQARAWPGR